MYVKSVINKFDFIGIVFLINNKMVSCLEDFHHTMDILNFSYFERQI